MYGTGEKSQSALGAYDSMRRERDSLARNLEFWKKRAAEKMAKEHSNGVTTGIIIASGFYGVLGTIIAIIFW